MSDQGFEALPVWLAPAKINRFLHITGRRADGYHELQTVFQFLDIADQLRFRVRNDGRVTRVNDIPGIPADEDLVVKAARLLQQDTGCAEGADILVTKKLPMGGGLGGGSSDAATTLVALNELWELGLDVDHLAGLGLQLGADVPVFVRGRSAWAEGVGEILEPVILAEPWYLVLVPEVSVSTADLFNDPRLTRDLPPIKIRDFLAAPDREAFCGQCSNVFEPLVRDRYRDIDEAINWLGKYSPARLTGTGACVFATFEEESRAREVAEQVRGRWGVIVARGCNRSPLFTR
ncbi:4-(cytidine 5'-diphospho)-2-C-methyl-D-erythritol kinase [Kaarinaea lacus]